MSNTQINKMAQATGKTSDELWEEINKAKTDFRLGTKDAIEMVVKKYENQTGETFDDYLTAEEANQSKEGTWMDARVKVTYVSNNDKIGQIGRGGDETGTIKILKQNTNKFQLESGKSYSISNAVMNEYNGEMQITITKNSYVTELEEDIKVKFDNFDTYHGMFTNISDKSGIVERCSECNRPLDDSGVCKNKDCKMVGKSIDKPVKTLRVMGHFDYKGDVKQIFVSINNEKAEQILGMTVEEVEHRIIEEVDPAFVCTEATTKLCGRYYDISVTKGDFQNLVEFNKV